MTWASQGYTEDTDADGGEKVFTENTAATVNNYMTIDTIKAYIKGPDDNFVTDAEKTVVENTSGANTGDQSAGDFNHGDLANLTGTAGQYNHPTDAQSTVLSNTSGTNTGDAPADDTAYNATSWNGNLDAATKNAIRDKIETMSGGSPGGSDTQVQYNNGGAFGGASALVYDDVNGRVGVNGTPLAALHVDTGALGEVGQIIKGVASQSANLQEWQDSTGTALAMVDASGNVGIGITPDELLTVNGVIKAGNNLGATGGSTVEGEVRAYEVNAAANYVAMRVNAGKSGLYRLGKDFFIYYDNLGNTVLSTVHGGGDMKFNILTSTKMILLDSGNVGIGDLTPASELTVAGDIETTGSANGIILESPDTTRYRVTVANGGTLSIAAV